MRPRALGMNAGWRLQSSARLEGAGGDLLSRPGVDTADWYAVDLPGTVLGALVDSGELGDPFHATNLRDIPGQGPPAQNFSNHPMPADSPFAVPWWYRKELRIPDDAPAYLRLQLDGINYRASVWLNGVRLADDRQLAGAYRSHELDVTAHVDRGGVNVLAIEVTAPQQCELAITWVDWNPSPPDKNMGIWRDVRLCATGPVAIAAPHVVSKLEGRERAHLTVGGDLVNLSDAPQRATVQGEIEGRRFSADFELEPRETRRFDIGAEQPGLPSLTPGAAAALTIESPRLWWPRHLGEPALYDLALSVSADGELSDATRFAFGIREVTSELTEHGHALFRINGEPLLIRGAGWATDLFLRRQPERDRAQLEYVKAMNLNTIRFEGMVERSEFLDWCDRDGVLVIAGWSCCDCWEKWDQWNDECHEVAPESLRSQVRRVRRHPSLITWWYGSDFPPPAPVEQRYLAILEEERWPNPKQSSAANKPTEISGPSGMKMEGPYEYVPPNYWLEDTRRGGAFGFATEICPGVAVPPIESLKKMLPAEHLWPVDEVWDFHAGGQEFHTIRRFLDAVRERLGEVHSAEELADLSQLMTYEAQRAMFEAYARNKYVSTGVIQWMLNNAWPSLIWHLYDHYLRPAGGFFGTQKACEPLHVLYGYPDRTVVVTNDYRRPFRELGVQARVYDLGLSLRHKASATVDVSPLGRVDALVLPEPWGGSAVHFVDLRLTAADGGLLSQNFYWLPTTPDEIDWEKHSWIHTPVSKHADLRALRQLPRGQVAVRATRTEGGEALMVEVRNPGDRLAFFVQARLADSKGDDLLPVIWNDNYVSLLPGESRMLRATVPGRGALPQHVQVQVKGLNVPAVTVLPEAAEKAERELVLAAGADRLGAKGARR